MGKANKDTAPKTRSNSKDKILNWFTCSTEPSEKGKISKKKIAIDLFEFSKFLIELGYVRYEKDGEYFIIRSIDQIVEVSKPTEIIDTVIDFIDNLSSDLVDNGKYKIQANILKSKIFSGISTYFSDNILNRCRSKEALIFLEDTKDKSFFFFNNCIVEVSKNAIKTLKYESIKSKYIWKDQILNRDFKELKIKDFIDSPFSKFISNISAINNPKEGIQNDEQRFESLASIIGYNLHKYYYGKLKATILTDSTDSENPEGRSGKTLLAKAMGKLLNVSSKAKTYIELNGKNFKFNDPKRYQECELDTRLVHLNDVLDRFNFELLFNDISEGIKAVQHYKAPFLINAKIIISSNRTIRIHGGSAKDRSIEFQLSNHYNSSNSPEKEFGHWFFRDWNPSQWLQFDNFMIYCVKVYLQNGLISPKSINLNQRKLTEETAREFVLFMDEYLAKSTDQKHEKKELYESFKLDFPDFNRSGIRGLTQRTFTAWCRLYAEYKDDYKKAIETRSNGKDLIEFSKNHEEPPF